MLLFICVVLVPAIRAQEKLKGADEAILTLNTILEKAEKPPGGKESAKKGAMKEKIRLLKQKWDAFLDNREELSPEASATQWLEIFDLYTDTSLNAKRMDWVVWKAKAGRSYHLLGEVPSTEVWDQWLNSLEKKAAGNKGEQPELSIFTSFLVAFLNHDKDLAWNRWKQFSKIIRDREVAPEDYEARQMVNFLDTMEQSVAKVMKQEIDLLKKFENDLQKLEKASAPGTQQNNFGMGKQLKVPKLAKLTSREKAKALWKRVFALHLKENELELDSDDAEIQLAATVLLEKPEQIKHPYWNLVRGGSAKKLYEVFEKKFPDAVSTAKQEQNYHWRNAVEEVVSAYLLKGELPAAVALAVRNASEGTNETWVNSRAVKQLSARGKGGFLLDYYKALQQKLPWLDIWDRLAELGVRTGRSKEVRELAETLLANEKAISPEARDRTLYLLSLTALADDEVEKGLKYLREKAALEQSEVDRLLKKGHRKLKGENRNKLSKWGAMLVNSGKKIKQLGTVTAQEKATKEGAAILNRWYKRQLTDYRKGDSGFADAIEYFIDNNAPVPAEKHILARLKKEGPGALQEFEKNSYPGRSPFHMPVFSNTPLLLVKLYTKAGRPGDVIDVFQKWPFWGATDISSLNNSNEELTFDLIKALEKTGKKETAAKILKAAMLKGRYTNKDKAYALLLRVDFDGALKFLDRLYARDAFEERPLIWKGTLLLKKGKTDEAEKVIRKAISIDPSDGEQGKGDRMRVYGVLADILEAKGKKKDATMYREVLKAIRISEDADDVYASGLTSRGIKQYNEALTHFADAYCIQSRLAKQLNEAGRYDEARIHYRRAFELMPDSFGRMESHCFGCEGVFSGENAEGIAEQVFSNLIKKQPDKPQLYYLLGYLRSSQDRDKEALELYEKAVQLDPDYINAWKKISGFRNRSFMSLKAGDAAAIALARLDPYDRHGGSPGETVFDVKGMLARLESVDFSPADGENGTFPLTASAKYINDLADKQIASAAEELKKRGIGKKELIQQLTQGTRTNNNEGPRKQIQSFLTQHPVLSSWERGYQALLRMKTQ